MNEQISELNTDVIAISYYICRMSGCPHGDTVPGFASWYKTSIAGGFETFANIKVNQSDQHTTYNEETKEETWTRILFNIGKLYEPVSCYEVGKMSCSKIEEKYHCQDEGGSHQYSYIVHFENGTTKKIVDTFLVE